MSAPIGTVITSRVTGHVYTRTDAGWSHHRSGFCYPEGDIEFDIYEKAYEAMLDPQSSYHRYFDMEVPYERA